ncbi:unnamed protein product [Closterium sp. Naga37s-1]|nr:unnamed protein product [Closterium sp. Naga37s-1]
MAPAAPGGCWQPQSPAAATSTDSLSAAAAASSSSSSSLAAGEPEAASVSPRTSNAGSESAGFLSSPSRTFAPPLEPQTLAGKWLLRLLASVPAMVPTAVDAELRRLQEEVAIGEGANYFSDRAGFVDESVFAVLGRANGAAAGPLELIQGESIDEVRWTDEANLLQSRIWRLQRRDQHDELQELLYALVALQFVSQGHTPLLRALPLLPVLPPSPWQRSNTYSRDNTISRATNANSNSRDSLSASTAVSRVAANSSVPFLANQSAVATPAASAAAACCTGLRKMLSPTVRGMVSRHLAMVMASQLEQAPRGVPTSGNDGDRSSGNSANSGGIRSTNAGSSGTNGVRNVGAVARPYGPGVLKSSRLRLGQIYASSITYGYFLRQVDLRLELEACWQLNQASLLEGMLLLAGGENREQLQQQQQQQVSVKLALERSSRPTAGEAAEPPGSAGAASSVLASSSGEIRRVLPGRELPSQDGQVTGSQVRESAETVRSKVGAAQIQRNYLERCWNGARDGTAGGAGNAGGGMRKADIGAYLRRMDPGLVRQMSKIHSRESLRVIERHTEALFGPPVWEEGADGSLAVRDEVVWLTAGGVERLAELIRITERGFGGVIVRTRGCASCCVSGDWRRSVRGGDQRELSPGGAEQARMQADSAEELARLGGNGEGGGFPITLGVRAWPEWNQGALFVDKIQRGTAQAHTSVLDFYCNRYPHSASPQGWLDRIGNGQVTLNGTRVTDPATPLSPSDCLCYHRTPWQEPPAPCHFTALYQDAHVLVLSKPSGLQVLRGAPFHQRTLLSLLALHARNRLVPVPLPATDVEAAEAAAEAAEAEGTATDRVPSATEGVAAVLQSAESNGARAADSASASALSVASKAGDEEQPQQQHGGRQQQQECGIDWARDTMEPVHGMASPAHRIGRGTSGLLICGISATGKAKLAADFASATTRGDAAAHPSHRKGPERRKGRNTSSSSSSSGGGGGGDAGDGSENGSSTSSSSSSSGNDSSSSGSGGSSSADIDSCPRIVKFYRALVQGVVVPDEQAVRVPIGRVRYGAVVGGLYMASPTGKPAVSVLSVLHRHVHANQTLLEVPNFPHAFRVNPEIVKFWCAYSLVAPIRSVFTVPPSAIPLLVGGWAGRWVGGSVLWWDGGSVGWWGG